jgi:predicted nucleic acid-binding protein
LKKDLGEHKRVGLDTCVFIHHFEGGELSELTAVVLERVQDGRVTGCVSALSLTEVLVKPLEKGLDGLADLYRVVFHEMPNLETVSVDQEVASKAAWLRASQGLGLGESIVLACALQAGTTAFITDKNIKAEINGLQVLALEDYL